MKDTAFKYGVICLLCIIAAQGAKGALASSGYYLGALIFAYLAFKDQLQSLPEFQDPRERGEDE